MENIKKGIMFFGAVAIALMMASSATAVLQHIDSNIKIKEKHLKMLEDAYNSNEIDNQDFKTLLGQIIQLVKTKGTVNSNDIKKIINDNDLAISEIYGARGISTDGRCSGSCGPHVIRPFHWGGFLTWSACASDWPGQGISVHVGPYTYTSDHDGLALSYFGWSSCDWTFDMTHGERIRFGIGGFGFLIFVS